MQYIIFKCEKTCDICHAGGVKGVFCGECYLNRNPETDCVTCDPDFIEVNGKCLCPNGYMDDLKGSCIPCPDKKEGDGEGGCKCVAGLE